MRENQVSSFINSFMTEAVDFYMITASVRKELMIALLFLRLAEDKGQKFVKSYPFPQYLH